MQFWTFRVESVRSLAVTEWFPRGPDEFVVFFNFVGVLISSVTKPGFSAPGS